MLTWNIDYEPKDTNAALGFLFKEPDSYDHLTEKIVWTKEYSYIFYTSNFCTNEIHVYNHLNYWISSFKN